MKRSTDRTQTTHVGSIPRPDSLVDYMIAEDKGEARGGRTPENPWDRYGQ